MLSSLIHSFLPMWPLGLAVAGVGALGKLAEPRARRAELVRKARERALREQLLADARAELAATRKAV